MFGGETLVRSHGSENSVEVFSILGPPGRARAGAGSLYTYVNGRFMRDKLLLRAVTQAFGGTLERGRYPVGVIALPFPWAASTSMSIRKKPKSVLPTPRRFYAQWFGSWARW